MAEWLMAFSRVKARVMILGVIATVLAWGLGLLELKLGLGFLISVEVRARSMVLNVVGTTAWVLSVCWGS